MKYETDVEAVIQFANAYQTMLRNNVVRSTRIVGDIGEWYAAGLYNGEIQQSQTQKGWDIREQSTGERLQVKTQTFDLNRHYFSRHLEATYSTTWPIRIWAHIGA